MNLDHNETYTITSPISDEPTINSGLLGNKIIVSIYKIGSETAILIEHRSRSGFSNFTQFSSSSASKDGKFLYQDGLFHKEDCSFIPKKAIPIFCTTFYDVNDILIKDINFKHHNNWGAPSS
jgi:hypothetical protein